MLLVTTPAAAQYRWIGGQNKVRYDEFKWYTYDTPHFQISYYDRVEPSLERVASFAESAYDELARTLNFQVLDQIPMIIYATHGEFEQTNLMPGFVPEGVGAFATPVRNRMVLPVDLDDQSLQQLIAHELTHIFQYEILFQGRRGRAVYARPPLWFMEGMASFLADDENSLDEMYVRDAVLSDMVPPITQLPRGFLAYRFGHKVFEFIQDEWGDDGVRDFIFSFRGVVGGGLARPIGKTFNMDLEEFDRMWKAWLKNKYEVYADRGTPREFGRPFQIEGKPGRSHQASPVLSPSQDLVAAFTTHANDVDVALFGIPDRRLYKNLTKGYTIKYQYLISQGFTTAPGLGRDLAYSPDGDRVAVFARSERSRDLLLLNTHKGGIAKVYKIPLPIDQPLDPAYSPDGTTIAFRAILNGQWDIFLLDVATGEISNLTNDPVFDAAPTFRPNGKHLVYSSQVGEYVKLVGIDIENPDDREQLTFGEGNDIGATFSEDGQRLFFSSDRVGGVFDIFKLEAETRELERITYVFGAALNPVAADTLEGERVGFQAYHRGRWNLYSADANQGEPMGVERDPQKDFQIEPFLPAVSITVDPEDGKKVSKRKFFMDDAVANVGLDNEGNFLSNTYISLADHYGDRNIWVIFSSIDIFSNFRAGYVNREKRTWWGATIYDNRSFYRTGYDPLRDEFLDRQQTYRVTGATFDVMYPLSRYYRLEGNLGYFDRSANLPAVDEEGNLFFPSFKEQAPVISGAVVGDTVLFNNYGPHQGSRFEFRLTYAHDIDDGGALTQQFVADYRKYFALSRRTEFAFRWWGGFADGNNPTIFGIGGVDTVRGYPVRSLAGNQATFMNFELRFPLIDRMDFSFMSIGNIRGRFFLDVGYTCYNVNGQEYDWRGIPGDCTFIGTKEVFDPVSGELVTVGESGRLMDGVSSYGWGLSVNLFGMPFHFDWIKLWDFKETQPGSEFIWWIGWQF
jgi:Tol biopolymer transport system component